MEDYGSLKTVAIKHIHFNVSNYKEFSALCNEVIGKVGGCCQLKQSLADDYTTTELPNQKL